jgi:sugar-specific transcriptional regulator TrmB
MDLSPGEIRMTAELPDMDFQRFWRRLQQLGLNAYEARSYLVLVGHPRFKALELAARAHVPRQKIYEVLDSLVEKGFAQVVQEKTKLFSAVEPSLAIPSYLARRAQLLERELTDQARMADGLVSDLGAAYFEGRGERGTLDYLRIVSDPEQTAIQYRRMLSEVKHEYLEFSRPPYAVDPLDEQLVKKARIRGVACRLLIEPATLDHTHRQRLNEYALAGVEIGETESLPMKLAVFDGARGLLALLDPVITRPTWTAVVFEHAGMGEAIKGLFENYWRRRLETSSVGIGPSRREERNFSDGNLGSV